MAKMRVVAASAIIAAVCGLGQADDSDVAVLGKANFDQTLAENKRVLVEFYAPWCGHCKQLEPEWNLAATKLKAEGLTTVLATVDATVEQELAWKYKVENYPAIKYFEQGKSGPSEYEGGRTHDGIMKWVRARELPLVTEIPQDGLESFLTGVGENEYALVARVVKKSARAKAFLKVVEENLGPLVQPSIANIATVKFGIIYMPKGADPEGAKANTTLVMFRPSFEEPDAKVHRFEGKWVASQMVQFAQAALYPTVGRKLESESKLYGSEAFEALGKDGLVAVAMPITGDDAKDEEQRKELVKDLAQLAKKESRWVFTLVQRHHSSPDASPLHSIAISKGQKKYVHKVGKEPAGSAAVEQFLGSVKAAKAKPFHKSADTPDNPVDSDGVTMLVGNTFEEYAMDPKRDVFVEFYAPWCGHCKKLSPVWSALAQRAETDGWAKRGVVIAKMDGTLNSCDEEISGFPHLVFYPAVKASKKMANRIIYSGARELEPLFEFVVENALSLEGFDGTGKKDKFNQVQRELAEKKKKKKQKGDEL